MFVAVIPARARAASATSTGKPLVDVTSSAITNRLHPSSKQVSAVPGEKGLTVTIEPGKEGYPGVAIKPPVGEKAWDLSPYGHIEAKVVNTGKKGTSVHLRVDNAGDWHDNPWNTEGRWINPGQTRTIKVIFGYAYGHKRSYKLDASKVIQLLFFTGKAKKEPIRFRIESITVGGEAGEKPPVKPGDIRVKPDEHGLLMGDGLKFDAVKQIKTHGGAKAAAAGGKVRLTFPAGKRGSKVELTPAMGRWDLRNTTDVLVTVKNVGDKLVTPRALVSGKGGGTAWASAAQPVAPGATTTIDVPFAPGKPWVGIPDATKTHWNGVKDTGTRFTSDAVKSVELALTGDDGGEVEVESIAAKVVPADVPEWVGKRPPTPPDQGDWVKTFDDEFDGPSLDMSKWDIYGHNYWDKKSHFSKNNVILGNGVVKLRFSKQRGHQNDDPNNKKVTDYATGFLQTYGKWTQRYGYFEARMKVPTAPGIWPAFWMMPDRGEAAGAQWKRQDTAKGGMEFDIMEHLTRWGPYRYNIAMHWDGYGKHHKQTGTSAIYVRPDKDGYITAGLLWLPGKVVYYCNGKEVASWTSDRVSNVPADLMFTLPSGGWDNNALDNAKLPDDFVIDYVRCWQRRDLKGE